MKKIITVGNEQILLSNNAAWVLEYREQFGRDILPAIMPLVATVIETGAALVSEAGDGEEIELKKLAGAIEGRAVDILLPLYNAEFVDLIVNVTWAMAKAADDRISPPKQWLAAFEEFPLDVIVPEVFNLAVGGFVSRKNLERVKNLIPKLRNLRPLKQTTSSSPESNED